MESKCEDCGKEFTSEREFEEHQYIEAMKKVAKRQIAETNWIASAILSANVLTVQKRDHCTIRKATRTFWKDTMIINQEWNRLQRERPGSPDAPNARGVDTL